MRSLLVAAAASAAVLVPAGLASPAQTPPAAPAAPTMLKAPVRLVHQPPVDAPVVDLFRPPASPFGPGNRGIDYATGEGSPVRASADGVVVFAGPVGGRLHVVIRHDDGIRTSYSFLTAVGVRRGQWVSAGDEVGRSGPSLHFGARSGDAYVDPLSLFAAASQPKVHLVPDEPAPEGPRPRPPAPVSPVSRSTVTWARSAAP